MLSDPPGAPGPAAPPPIAPAAVGPVVHITPAHFVQLLGRSGGQAVVLHQPAGFLRPHRYLTSYKGLYLLTRSSLPIELPRWAEVILVKHLRMPS
jgi:hypothetical protein